ncbi:RHS repeat-associated core domain-containing protein [Rhizobium sp. FY34]|uniref:RHS repeat-associated core domain-containing protein n=1 Tax=Rhizobium sp. FY34 TaxID=2562309 RepID=UPI0010C14CEE|nr:RHS repeat-associated core domain-containing protein [Rhizobium sp. FY34]
MTAHYAGFMPGKFSTTKSGQSAYHVPIKTPPGTAKMKPSIAFSYVGNQRNGLLGVGFTLSGLLTIERMGQTMAQDGQWTGVDYSANDRFNLAGERLVAVSGVYGASGTEYRTERESWARVVSYGDRGGGPQWFEVTSRSGRKMLFGSEPSARVPILGGETVRVWALNRVTDLNGNYYTVSYELDEANGAHRPDSIDYTGNDTAPLALIPNRRVEFSYEDRPDPIRGYRGGYSYSQTQRLKSVATYVGPDLVRTYSLGYRDSTLTRRSELETITESDGEGLSLPPLTLTRPLEPSSWLAPPIRLQAAPAGAIPETYTSLTGDLTGDGRTDLMLFWTSGDSALLAYAVFLAQADGSYAAPVINTTPCSMAGGQFGPVPVDISGSGRSDLVVFYMQANQLACSTLVWENSEFTVSDPTPLQFDSLPQGLVPQVVPIDLTGDGKSDLFIPFSNANQMMSYYILTSDGATYSPLGTVQSLSIPMESNYSSMIFAANISGSPRQEIVCGTSGLDTNDIYVLSFDGESFSAQSPLQLDCGVGDGNYLFPITSTGGGLTDAAFVWQDATMRLSLKVLVSDGTRIVEPVEPQPILDLGQNAPAISPVDLTGDGRTDLLLYALDGAGNTVVTPYLASGGSFVVQAPIPTGLNIQPFAIATPDICGIGKSDLLIAAADASAGPALQFHVFRSSAPRLGLVETISNGAGGTISIAYLPTTDPRVYSDTQAPSTDAKLAGRGSAAGVAPVQFGSAAGATAASAVRHVIDIPGNLVWSVTTADGRGHCYAKQHHYADGLVSLEGRGWLGFASSAVSDLDTSSTHQATYHQGFPLTGMTATEFVGRTGSPSPLRLRNYEYAVTSGATDKVFIAQLHRRTTTINADFSTDAASYSETHGYDDFGNQLTTSYVSGPPGGAADLFATRTFDNDKDNWCLGLLRSLVVSSDAAGLEVLRRKELTYDPVTKQLTSTSHWNSSDPGDSPTFAYGYDPFGNRTSVAASNGALTTCAFEPDTAYAYPRTRTRKASGSVDLVDTYAYDRRFGVSTTHIDANGNVRSRTLDGLGRIAQTFIPGPSGPVTFTTINRQNDPAGGYLETSTQIQSWDGTLSKVRSRRFDGLGRLYSTTYEGQGNPPAAPRTMDRRFDSNGRVVGQTLPYQVGQPVLWATKAFDPLGRLVEQVRPIGEGENAVTNIWYSGIDRTIVRGQDSPDAVTTFERAQFYNGRTRVVERRDELGRSTYFQFDPLGRITSVTPPTGLAQTVNYTSLGTKSSVYAPEMGQANLAFHYAKRRVSVTYVNGGGFEVEQDLLKRPVNISLPGDVTYALTYDGLGPGNRLGRLTSVTAFRQDSSEPLYSWRLQYDPSGRPALLQLTILGETLEQQRSYTPAGLIAALVFHDKESTHYSYDGLAQIRKMTFRQADGQEKPIATYDAYNAFGLPGTSLAGNGAQRQWLYTGRGLVQSHRVVGPGPDGAVLLSRSFAHDTFGRIRSVKDTATGRVRDAFDYDEAGQLQAWTDSEGSVAQVRFDAGGNVLATGSRTIAYDGSTLIVTPATGEPYSLSYDKLGNRSSTSQAPAQTFKYDQMNRLIASGPVELIYDHNGRRLVKSGSDGRRAIYLTPDDIIDSNGSAVTRVKLLRDPYGVAAVIETPSDGPQRAYFLEHDHVASTILVTGDNGAAIAEPRYEPFGRLLNPNPMLSPYIPGFGGQPFDPETGLAYFNARYLDPDIGRFITADTQLGGGLTTTNALNRYAYALNDPINLADPSGHAVWEWILSSIASVLEIVGGAALAALGAETAGRALIGAGVGGLAYDVQGAARGQDFSLGAWAVAEGMGAVAGISMGASAEPAGAAVAIEDAGDAQEFFESESESGSSSGSASESASDLVSRSESESETRSEIPQIPLDGTNSAPQLQESEHFDFDGDNGETKIIEPSFRGLPKELRDKIFEHFLDVEFDAIFDGPGDPYLGEKYEFFE